MRRLFLIIACFYIVGYISHALYLHKTVYGDGIYYYSFLRSIVVNHNLNFTDEYSALGGFQPKTPFGVPGNKYSIGPALLWTPGYLWIHTVVRGTGYEFPYQLIVGLESILYCLFSLVLLYRVLAKHVRQRVAVYAICAIAGATNLLFYGSLDPVNSHALSFFAVTLFLNMLLSKKRRWFLVGLSLGLVGIIRMQDLCVGILIITFIKLKNIPQFVAGLLIGIFAQLVVWQILYGTLLNNPYLTGHEGFTFLRPHIAGVLFSPNNGLFLWTPMALAWVIGLVLRIKEKFYVLMVVVFLCQLIIVACWSTWWQGASYRGRMFVSTLPLLAFGLGWLFESLDRIKLSRIIALYAIILPMSLINVFLITYFLLTH